MNNMNPRRGWTVLLVWVILFSATFLSIFVGAPYFGSQYRGISVSGEYFDAPGDKFAVRFTAQEDKSVANVSLYLGGEGTDWNATVGIQGDSGGEPDGTFIGANNITVQGGIDDWQTFTLASTVALTNQTVYHIVFDFIWADGTHRVYFRGTHNRGGQSGYNTWITTHNLADSNLRYEANLGAGWVLRTRTPIFVITYTDGSFLGQPYTSVEIAQKVYGSNFHGEYFISPSYQLSINTLGIYIRKQSTPGDLNISLETETGTILRSVIIPVEDGYSLFDWEQDSITRITLNASTVYRLRLRSPGGDSGNYWDVNHPYMDYSSQYWGNLRNATFGGIISRWDGGGAGYWYYDDLSFRLNITTANIDPISDVDGPYSGYMVTPITFDGTGSSDSDGSIVSYDWDYGNGDTGVGATPSYSYPSTGQYTVTLTVTDNEGGTNSSQAACTVVMSDEQSFGVNMSNVVLVTVALVIISSISSLAVSSERELSLAESVAWVILISIASGIVASFMVGW